MLTEISRSSKAGGATVSGTVACPILKKFEVAQITIGLALTIFCTT